MNAVRDEEAMGALWAAPCNRAPAMLLSTWPGLTAALHALMQFVPAGMSSLTACAVFAKVCYAELAGNRAGAAGATAAQLHPFCSLAAETGLFGTLYSTVIRGLKVCLQEF